MLHILRTVGAMIVQLYQPVAPSKLHGHSHNGYKDIWHCLNLWLNFSHLTISEPNNLDKNNFNKCSSEK